MFEVLRLGRMYKLSVKLQLELFDKLIKPILLCGCEVWGFGKIEILERIHLKFCKTLLNLKSTTPNYLVYGELGRYPINIDIKVRCITFWGRLVTGKQSKLSNIVYILSRKLDSENNGNGNFKWLKFIQNTFNECGFTHIWDSESFHSVEFFKSLVKQRLLDQFVQHWFSLLNNSPKALNYRIF